jgi:hypothetical protein
MSFEKPLPIREVIQNIASTDFVLPAIQREFVWDSEQIEKLFDSLLRGYPIGSFLFWRVKADHTREFQFYRFMDRYHQRDLRHNEPIELMGERSVIAVLDGQQRLTALNIGLRGWHAEKMPYYRWSSDHAFPKRRLYLNLMAPPEDQEFAYEFEMLRDKDLKSAGDDKFWFPVGKVLEFEDLGEIFNYCLDHDLTQTGNKFPHETLMKLWQCMCNEPHINYYLEKEQNLDKVLNIFIRVNSGGTQLSYSDMLLSIATAKWKTRDARQEIHGLVDRLNEVGEGFDFNKDFVLKASLVLTDIPNIAFRVDNFNLENMSRIEDEWDRISGALELTARLLSSWGYERRTLVSNYAAIPIAYHLLQKDLPSNYVESSKYEDDRRAIHRWLITALLKRTFGGNPDSVLRPIRTAIHENPGSFPIDEIFDALSSTSKNMRFDRAEIEGLLGYRYGKRYTYTVLALLYPWLRFDQRFHVDHIFPRSRFNKREFANHDVPPEHWDRWVERRDDLANLQLLQGTPNQEKSDKPFEEWFETKFPTDDDKAAYRRRHLIPDVELSFENFPEFMAAREKLIYERLAEILEVREESLREGMAAMGTFEPA